MSTTGMGAPSPEMHRTKKCARCGELKAVTDFYRHASTRDGRRGTCRRCWTIQTVDRRRITRPRQPKPTETERFLSKVDTAGDGCWEWIGARHRNGYGLFQAGRRSPANHAVPEGAHRVAYRLFVGTIPENAVIDHLCRNRACVRPEHLEAVSSGENTRRGLAHGRRLTVAMEPAGLARVLRRWLTRSEREQLAAALLAPEPEEDA